MLDRDEHDKLSQIEVDVAATDPAFAMRLRKGQRRLSSRRRRFVGHTVLALLVLLTYVVLVLGLPSSALALAALAMAVWWLRRWPIRPQPDHLTPPPHSA